MANLILNTGKRSANEMALIERSDLGSSRSIGICSGFSQVSIARKAKIDPLSREFASS
jgi:hypothetical protein